MDCTQFRKYKGEERNEKVCVCVYAVNHHISLRTFVAHCYALSIWMKNGKKRLFSFFLRFSLFWSRTESVGWFARERFHAYIVWNLRNSAIAKMHGWWLYKMICQAWDEIIIKIYAREIGRRREEAKWIVVPTCPILYHQTARKIKIPYQTMDYDFRHLCVRALCGCRDDGHADAECGRSWARWAALVRFLSYFFFFSEKVNRRACSPHIHT